MILVFQFKIFYEIWKICKYYLHVTNCIIIKYLNEYIFILI